VLCGPNRISPHHRRIYRYGDQPLLSGPAELVHQDDTLVDQPSVLPDHRQHFKKWLRFYRDPSHKYTFELWVANWWSGGHWQLV
jgi:hypothetical protein